MDKEKFDITWTFHSPSCFLFIFLSYMSVGVKSAVIILWSMMCPSYTQGNALANTMASLWSLQV